VTGVVLSEVVLVIFCRPLAFCCLVVFCFFLGGSVIIGLLQCLEYHHLDVELTWQRCHEVYRQNVVSLWQR
jgi:hypothetical protein